MKANREMPTWSSEGMPTVAEVHEVLPSGSAQVSNQGNMQTHESQEGTFVGDAVPPTRRMSGSVTKTTKPPSRRSKRSANKEGRVVDVKQRYPTTSGSR